MHIETTGSRWVVTPETDTEITVLEYLFQAFKPYSKEQVFKEQVEQTAFIAQAVYNAAKQVRQTENHEKTL